MATSKANNPDCRVPQQPQGYKNRKVVVIVETLNTDKTSNAQRGASTREHTSTLLLRKQTLKRSQLSIVFNSETTYDFFRVSAAYALTVEVSYRHISESCLSKTEM